MTLSIIIPCYNEQKNIPLIIDRVQEVFGGRSDVEVLLVDNGSRDNTADALESDPRKDSVYRVVSVSVNQGYGFGILAGLAAAKGDVLAWTHADMQTDPKDILTAYDVYRSSTVPLIVKGRRRNRQWLEKLFSTGMQIIASYALRVRFHDVNAQPKLFSASFYQSYLAQGAPADFSLDLYLLYQAQRNGYAVKEVDVVYKPRLFGEAKGGGSWKTRIQLIKRTWKYIFALRSNLRSGKVV